jgi:hypothetical protein
MLALNGLPRFYHPTFRADAFARATDDAFYLSIEASDPNFDPEATPANGGTSMLIHDHSLPVDHLTVQDNGSVTDDNHGRRTCNLHRLDSWCNLFGMARVTQFVGVTQPNPANHTKRSRFTGVESTDHPGCTDPL